MIAKLSPHRLTRRSASGPPPTTVAARDLPHVEAHRSAGRSGCPRNVLVHAYSRGHTRHSSRFRSRRRFGRRSCGADTVAVALQVRPVWPRGSAQVQQHSAGWGRVQVLRGSLRRRRWCAPLGWNGSGPTPVPVFPGCVEAQDAGATYHPITPRCAAEAAALRTVLKCAKQRNYVGEVRCRAPPCSEVTNRGSLEDCAPCPWPWESPRRWPLRSPRWWPS